MNLIEKYIIKKIELTLDKIKHLFLIKIYFSLTNLLYFCFI
jgi:hypothetical protein